MSLFNFGHKDDCGCNLRDEVVEKEANASKCHCNQNCECKSPGTADTTDKKDVSIKILGSGCAKCNRLEANAKEALNALGMNTTIEHVTDPIQIGAYGVMSTPAIVVNDEVAGYGKILSKDEIVNILQDRD